MWFGYISGVDIRQLRYFMAIAEAGSLSAAAAHLHVAQPALSQHLMQLEAELGTRLMTRSVRGVTLTETGHVLLEHAFIVLRDIQRARDAVQAEVTGPVCGTVTIGLPTTVAMLATLPLLVAMRERHPELSLHLLESQSGHLLDWLRSGRVDIAILFELAGTGRDLAHGITAEKLVVEDLYFVSPPSEAGGGEKEITLAEAVSLPVCLPSREHGFRRVLDGYAGQIGGVWNVVAEIDALPAVKHGVTAGIAHTVLPLGALLEEVRRGELVARRIVEPQLKRTALLARANDRPETRVREAAHACILATVHMLVERRIWPATLIGLK